MPMISQLVCKVADMIMLIMNIISLTLNKYIKTLIQKVYQNILFIAKTVKFMVNLAFMKMKLVMVS